jgi:AraC-like DNA-binding protein
MCKPGPDCTVLPNAGWAPMPQVVTGFSQTHVSGTGGGQKYGNVLLMPFTVSPAEQKRVTEDFSLGYYATTFENAIRTEITTAVRCAFYRFSYPARAKENDKACAQLLIDARMQYAARLLTNERRENKSISVADIAFKCGYTDPKYFSRCFKLKYGVAPSDYTTEE